MRHAARPYFSRPLVWLAALVAPRFYLLYMGFVWVTSRVRHYGLRDLDRICAEHNGAVALLWHEEAVTVAYAYRHLRFRPHALVSISATGEVLARLLERCGFAVFRGGSSRKASRRKPFVRNEMIEYMRTHEGVLYFLAVDGSNGPPYRMKRGGIVIAGKCGKPIVLLRTWYERCIRLNTWDRAAIPLPFNRISYYVKGPYPVPDDASTGEGLESFRLQLENDLIDLAARSYDEVSQPRPANLTKREPRSQQKVS